MKRATLCFKYFVLYNIISIHALVKRATKLLPFSVAKIGISIHALVKRATLCFKYFVLYNIISIHALVKRATKLLPFSVAKIGISIHALVKRATRRVIANIYGGLYFNPRPREEATGSKQIFRICMIFQSHALVKRATSVKTRGNSHLPYFQSIFLVKRAIRAAQKNYHGARFQSTPS